MKKIDMDRYRPLGRERSQYIQIGWVVLAVALLMSLEFVARLFDQLDHLYDTHGFGAYATRTLRPGAVMVSFASLIEDRFMLVPFFWVFMGLEVWDCYDYHKKATKSIYLMRRLPDKWDLHRRCWGRPVIYCILSLLAVAAMTILYFLAYLAFTPWECLPY